MARPRGMSHVALCARDFDRSLHFYRDLLGFKVSQEGTNVEGRGEDAGIYRVKNRKVKFATLRYGRTRKGPYGMTEDAPIVVIIAPEGRPPTGKSIKVDQVGISHMGFWVKGLNAMYKDLKAKGVKFAAAPHVLAKTEEGTIRSAFAEDPDGILIQLDEMIPAKKAAPKPQAA